MSHSADQSHDQAERKRGSRAPLLDDALETFRAEYRRDAAPGELEASVLAQMRAARARAKAQSMPHAASRLDEQALATIAQGNAVRARTVRAGESSQSVAAKLWRYVSGRWWSSALAGSLATVIIATASSPLWLHYFRESVEVATPFMLVSEPKSASLDVSQMLRVNVTREAMLDFGIPVPPARLNEQVKAEMLMGGQGEVLAVRFIEPEKKQRWRWQMY